MISPYRRARVIAAGLDAAAKLRAKVNRAGHADCALCGSWCLSSGVDIDHVTPLYKGGEDVPANVQVLCKGCHKAKTRRDMGYAAPPF